MIKERVRVGEDKFIDVRYSWEIKGDKVEIWIEYDDGHMDYSTFWPVDTGYNEERARDIVWLLAAADYNVRELAGN